MTVVVVPVGHVAASVTITPATTQGFVHAGDNGEPLLDLVVCAAFSEPVKFVEALITISGTMGVAIHGPEHGSTTSWCGTAHNLNPGGPGVHTIGVDWRAHNGNGLSQGYSGSGGSYTVAYPPPTPKKSAEDAAALGHASNSLSRIGLVLGLVGAGVGIVAGVATGGLAWVVMGGIIAAHGGVLGFAGLALSDAAIDPPDPAYTLTVVAQQLPMPTVSAGPGISPAAAAALNALHAHLGNEAGEARAMVAALYKSEGAAQANNAGWEKIQTLAAANFAHLLAVDLQAEAALRAAARSALEAGGFPVVGLAAAQAQGALDLWNTTGLPADQINALTVGGARPDLDDQFHARANSLDAADFAVANILDLLAPPPGWTGPNVNQANTEAANALQAWADHLTATPVGPVLAGPAIITGVSPAQGSASGGTSVTITGINLSATTSVKFGSTSVSGGTCSDTECIAITPPGVGVVSVSVSNPGGISKAADAAQYAFVTATAGPVHPPPGDLVGDGGFDPPTSSVVDLFQSLNPTTGSASLGRWKISAGNVDLVGPSSAQAAEGVQFVDLNGNGDEGPGTLTRTIQTMPGHRYRLSFRMAGNPNGEPDIKTVQVTFGLVRKDFAFDVTGHENVDLGWAENNIDTLTCDDHLDIKLASTTGGDRGPIIDAVNVVDLGLAPAGSCQAQLFSTRYIPLNPARLLETRTGAGLNTIDGQANGIGVLGAGTVTQLQVGGRGGVAADAAGVVLNVTAIDARSPGFITVFPCGSPRPNAANVTYAAGQTAPNSVVARIGTAGKVCMFTYGSVDLVVDVNGYFPAGNPYQALNPARLLDTRNAPGLGTIDGDDAGVGVLGAGTVTELHVTDRGGVARDAAAVALNVTAIDARSPGFITAYPCGSPRPNAANLTYNVGQTIPNAILVQVGVGGDVCLFSYGSTDLAVDVNGYFPPDTSFVPLVPVRLLESRVGPGLGTIDGQANALGVRNAGGVTVLHVAGRGGVAIDAGAVVLNVTAVDPRAAGFVTAYPCGSDRPNAASLTYTPGANAPSAVVAQVGSNGDVCLFTYAAIDLVVDVDGYMI